MPAGLVAGNVQTPVVERERRRVGFRLIGERIEKRRAVRFGKARQVILQAHARDELAEAGAIVKGGRSRLEEDVDGREARLVEPLNRGGHVGELPRSPPAAEITRQGGRRDKNASTVEQPAEIGAAAALGNEPASRRERAVDAREELVVVEDPVERGRAQHGVERIDKRQRRAVRADEADPNAAVRSS